MRIKLVLWNLGKICIVVGLATLAPLLLAVYYKDIGFTGLLCSMLAALTVGVTLCLFSRHAAKQSLRQREGFALVSFAWIVAALLGSIPYLLSGVCPDFSSAIFESMSGYTTTGASVLSNLESLPRSIILWRSMTHWLGGMGIVVLLVAITSGQGSFNLYKAEAPGSSLTERLTPRIGDTSQILWITYIGLTIFLIFLLKLEGMSFFDALCHTFGTVSTGGFSTRSNSFADYSAVIQWTITLFMFLSGANIAFLYFLVVKRKNMYFRNEEFRFYLAAVLIATAMIAIKLLSQDYYAGNSIEYTLRQSAFQVVSIITTSGFATTDFNLWPETCKTILLVLFFIGGCVGGTSGSLKVSRIAIALKNIYVQLFTYAHPNAIKKVKLNGKAVPAENVINVLQFIFIFGALVLFGSLLMSLTGLNDQESLLSVLTCLTNVGPAFGSFGPVETFAHVSAVGKVILSIYMMLGRLELYTVLVLLVPSVWKK